MHRTAACQDFDRSLNSPEFANNPYPLYQALRESAPVYWSEAWRCWILTRYDDIQAVLRDPPRFTSLERLTSTVKPDIPEAVWEQIQPLVRHYSSGLVNVDPPDHTRLRNLVHKAFAGRTISKLQGYVQQLVDQLLDKVQGDGHMDLVRDLAYPLPVTVIAELLGVPLEDHDKLKRWSSGSMEFMTTPLPTPKALLRSQEALLNLRDFFRKIYTQCRQQPDDKLVSTLLAVRDEGERLSEEDLLSTCVTLLVAGHETTSSLISGAVLALLQNPDQLRKLRENPALIEGAVEESLRYDGPFQRNRRIAREDVTIEGKQIGKGQLVLVFLGAANRDPSHFPDPDRFDIERIPNRHISFGAGVHFCLGASLARLEARIAINAILSRMPDLRLATETLEWENHLLRGLKALPVSF